MEGAFPPNSFCENFLNTLCWETTVWIQIVEGQTSKQSAGEWMFSCRGMKAWRHGWDSWGGGYLIDHVVKEAHITRPLQMLFLLIVLHHLQKPRRAEKPADRRASEVSRRWSSNVPNETSVTGRTLSSSPPGRGLVASLPPPNTRLRLSSQEAPGQTQRCNSFSVLLSIYGSTAD